MTDRELLERAAKALGYGPYLCWDDKWACLTDYEGWTFDPLRDDGDLPTYSVDNLAACLIASLNCG